MFPQNEATLDRVIRVTAGGALLSLLYFLPVPGWGLLGLVGLVPLATGLVGTCPIYAMLGVSTCRT